VARPNYFTIEEAYAAQRAIESYRTSAEILRKSIETASATSEFDVFLSHSSKDADLILGVKTLLEERGLSVYVDWIVDPELDRSNVTAATADILRKRMHQCESLIYAATSNAANSKWMPWELGYFDGHRGDEHVAIMPFVEHQGDAFFGQEYLNLYAVVRKDFYKNGRPDDFVELRGRRWMPLRDFGQKSKLWRRYGS
jgi:hypothetical protein